MVSILNESRLVQVIHGANEGRFDVAGKTVGKVRYNLQDAFNLSRRLEELAAFVNGNRVHPRYRLNDGDTLEFNYPFGRKGSDLPEPNEEKRYEQHPYGKVWSKFDNKTFSELMDDIKLNGLRVPILIYQGMVLDGWHRYQACLQTGVKPRFEEFPGSDLQAAELVFSTGIRREVTAKQRYEAFLNLMEASSVFKKKIERLQQEGKLRKVEGKPLSKDKQRIDVVGTKAKIAGVSRSTAASVEKEKRAAQEVVEELATGQIGGVRKKPERKNGTRKSKNAPAKANRSKDKKISSSPKGKATCLTLLENLRLHFDEISMIRDTLKEGKIKVTNLAEWETTLADKGQLTNEFQDIFKMIEAFTERL